PLEQAGTRLGLLARRPQRVAARDLLEHDPAPTLRVPVREELQRRFPPRLAPPRRPRQLVQRQRLGGDDQQRLDRASEALDRTCDDQAEVAVFHRGVLSSTSGRETLIGVNGAAWASSTSPALHSSSSARKAAACPM